MKPSFTQFRQRLVAREPLLGTFVKLPTTQAIEIFGVVGFDFVVIDQEHAPLDRAQVDLMAFAGRASNVAPIVRVGDAGDAAVLSALDCGASGIMFPHVTSVEKAKSIAASCRYIGGKRGFASMSRAGSWGARGIVDHMKAQDAEVACIAMIEDIDAVSLTAEIAAVDGIDAIFIGRGDLTASFGDDPHASAKVAEAARTIAEATRAAGKTLMILATSTADAETFRGHGASGVLVSSDHNFLKTAAAAAYRDYGVKTDNARM
ncbi:HpcH/HpaI aldolase family protein [Rhizobium terrae]|uniref:HpcH/HpaI aldolase family protein n=1 Tax=Rhizobium terrae TaxID=2171756 RepID=UPI000E3DBA58|nr:aldolase/citrate lyase family protein [Rhizobium terrae]